MVKNVDGSLAGLTVVEICNYVSGPMVGRNLATLGANVIKIERPVTGDDGRHSHPAFDGDGLFFTETAFGKKSVVLDLKSEAGLATAKRLIASADVLLENMRPSVMPRIGLDPAELVELNPRLIVASVSAFERDSPRADDPAYDPVIQAVTGMMFSTGFEGDAPRRIGASIIDKTTALWSTIQILAALMERERTGRGGHVAVSLLSSAVHVMGADIMRYFATGEDSAASQRPLANGASYGAYQANDGRWLQVAIGNDRMFDRLCRGCGHTELLEDPRFANHLLRGKNRVEEHEVMMEVFSERPSSDWVRILDEAKVPYALVNHISELVLDDEVFAPRLADGTRTDGTATIPLIRGPLDAPDSSPERRRVPRLGEDTVAVLQSVGLSEAQIAELSDEGAFGSDSGVGR